MMSIGQDSMGEVTALESELATCRRRLADSELRCAVLTVGGRNVEEMAADLQRCRGLLADSERILKLRELQLADASERIERLIETFDREVWMRVDDPTHFAILKAVRSWLTDEIAKDRAVLIQRLAELDALVRSDGGGGGL